jgi:hypothetical protein
MFHDVSKMAMKRCHHHPTIHHPTHLGTSIAISLGNHGTKVKAFQQSQHAAGNLAQKPQILVQPIALGPKAAGGSPMEKMPWKQWFPKIGLPRNHPF